MGTPRLRTTVIVAIGATAIAAAVAAGLWSFSVANPPTPVPQSDRILVAAVGDSNTYGTGVVFDNRGRNSYPAQLQSLLGDEYQVLNYGLSGRTLVDTGDNPYTDSDFFEASHEVGPDIVLIMLGTNDAKGYNWNPEQFEAQLRDFVATYQELPGHPAVYLLTPPAAYANATTIDPVIVAEGVVPIVRRVAGELGVELVDAYELTRGTPELFADGIHPDATGLGLIAKAVYSAIVR